MCFCGSFLPWPLPLIDLLSRNAIYFVCLYRKSFTSRGGWRRVKEGRRARCDEFSRILLFKRKLSVQLVSRVILYSLDLL
jgi:hypothetical protein